MRVLVIVVSGRTTLTPRPTPRAQRHSEDKRWIVILIEAAVNMKTLSGTSFTPPIARRECGARLYALHARRADFRPTARN
jgi:hypothetical protein